MGCSTLINMIADTSALLPVTRHSGGHHLDNQLIFRRHPPSKIHFMFKLCIMMRLDTLMKNKYALVHAKCIRRYFAAKLQVPRSNKRGARAGGYTGRYFRLNDIDYFQ